MSAIKSLHLPRNLRFKAWLGITTLQASPNLTDYHPGISAWAALVEQLMIQLPGY